MDNTKVENKNQDTYFFSGFITKDDEISGEYIIKQCKFDHDMLHKLEGWLSNLNKFKVNNESKYLVKLELARFDNSFVDLEKKLNRKPTMKECLEVMGYVIDEKGNIIATRYKQ